MDTPQVPFVVTSEQRTPSSRHERGQTLVVVAVMIVVLIAFLGLVIDGGNAYAQRRQMQNAADAAALAGARAQALQGVGATVSTADKYAKANGAGSCSVMTTTSTVTANASKTVETYFIRVIGVNTLSMAASATAEITTPDRLSCGFLPLTIPYRDPSEWPKDPLTIWQYCNNEKKDDCSKTIDIKESANGWLNLNGATNWAVGSNELKCWICPELNECKNVSNPGVDLGWTNGSPGLDTSALQAIDECAEGTIVYIPLYGAACCDQPSAGLDACSAHPDYHPDDPGNGQCHYDIVGFAPFRITYVKDTGDRRAIDAQYVPGYVGDNCLVVGSGGGVPVGLYAVKLIK